MLFIFTFLIKRFKKEHIVAFFERNVSLKGKATETIGTIESIETIETIETIESIESIETIETIES